MKYFVRISVRNWCRNKNRGRSSFVWNCCYSNLPNPHENIRIATFSNKTTSTSISISAPQKYANRCTVIHHYTDTYKKREDNIKKMKYFVRISVRNWCRNKNRGRSSFVWKLLLFESSQPTREDSNSNIFKQNYFYFDFYFCTPKNMQTDAQLYTIILTLTKEEKIT